MVTYIKINKYIRNVGISASILLVFFSLLTAFPLSHRDDSADATANPSTTTLTMTSASNVASVDLDVRNSKGSFATGQSNSNKVSFNVTTDNITGYALAISGTDTSGKLINSTIGVASFDTISSSLSYSEFSNIDNTSYNGKWGIQPSKYNSSSNSNYLPAPTTDSIIMDTTEGPNTSANYYSIGLGARANYNTPAGKYTNTFVVQAVGRPVMYGINYLDTTEDATVADLPVADSSSTSTAVNFTLDSGSPTRDGYTFIGWCDGTVDHTSYPSTCDGDTYMPGATYTFADPSASETNIVSFYAMWQVQAYTITFNTVDAASIDFNDVNYTNGQSVTVPAGTYSLRGNYAPRYAFSSWSATAGTISNAEYVDYNLNTYTVTEDATITLTGQNVTTAIQDIDDETFTSTDPIPVYDNRDDQVYWIKRLDDGNVWMMDNLNLGAIDLADDLTSANTNLADTISASTFNDYRQTDYTRTYTSAGYVVITKTNSSNGVDIDEVSGTQYGTVYNYCATTAGTICTQYNYIDATYDICPAGWRLPKGGDTSGTTNEFNNLYTNLSYNTNAKLRAPVSEDGAAFARAGSYGSDRLSYQGFDGRYWSSTRSSSQYMSGLYIGASSVSPNATTSNRYDTHSIRCILKKKPVITFHTVNAASIELNGVTYTDGQTAKVDPGTYSLRGKYGTKQAFSSWSATAGTISNANYVDYNLNTYEVVGDADITLTGQNVTTAIQNLSSSSCTSTPTPVFDNRDNQVYWIKRLDDGNCWMMDNLNLGAVYLSNNLTSSNTNLSTTISASDFNSYRKASGGESYTSAEYIVVTKANSETNDDVDETSGTKYGALYNYCAASAGTICMSMDSESNNATYDICPAGWRMPKSGAVNSGTNEFNNLYINSSYDTYDKMRAPVSENGGAFAIAGRFYDGGAPTGQSRFAGWWSSSKYTNNNMAILGITASSSSVSTLSGFNRAQGRSIRCILK